VHGRVAVPYLDAVVAAGAAPRGWRTGRNAGKKGGLCVDLGSQ
jgi:hypothetical protein